MSGLFNEIYQQGLWSHDGKQLSGAGSYGVWGKQYVELVTKIITKGEFKRIVDIGCGDFAVGSQLVGFVDKYIAVDVSDHIISINKSKFSNLSNVEFRFLDASEEIITGGELVLLRQVLQHLTNCQIERVLKNIELGGATFAIIAEDVPIYCIPNIDLPAHSGFTRGYFLPPSGVFIDKSPFNRHANLIGSFALGRRALNVWGWPLRAGAASPL
jgi:hypothetical protein